MRDFPSRSCQGIRDRLVSPTLLSYRSHPGVLRPVHCIVSGALPRFCAADASVSGLRSLTCC